MIVIGYQGIGKSTTARRYDGYIDLESSCFYHDGVRCDDWYVYYCQVAECLSKQGYIVFISSHRDVRAFIKKHSEEIAVVIYPSPSLSEQWIEKLRDRMCKTHLEKDYRAWINAVENYDLSISDLRYCGIAHIEIDNMNYDLHNMVMKAVRIYAHSENFRSAEAREEQNWNF